MLKLLQYCEIAQEKFFHNSPYPQYGCQKEVTWSMASVKEKCFPIQDMVDIGGWHSSSSFINICKTIGERSGLITKNSATFNSFIYLQEKKRKSGL